MNPDDFKESPSGSLVPTIQGCMAFVPGPLPPKALDLGRLASPLATAMHARGELSGLGRAFAQSLSSDSRLLLPPKSRALLRRSQNF
jgi:hypothetical protein